MCEYVKPTSPVMSSGHRQH
uniref:Uncharacterized protein n=1 Tax=Anguilla anguilla TaxID=7936 RepID=A0A0E9TFT5_ANGAN